MHASEVLHDNTKALLEEILGSSKAYIKPVVEEKGRMFGMFASDGTQLASFDSYEAAYSAARIFELDAVALH